MDCIVPTVCTVRKGSGFQFLSPCEQDPLAETRKQGRTGPTQSEVERAKQGSATERAKLTLARSGKRHHFQAAKRAATAASICETGARNQQPPPAHRQPQGIRPGPLSCRCSCRCPPARDPSARFTTGDSVSLHASNKPLSRDRGVEPTVAPTGKQHRTTHRIRSAAANPRADREPPPLAAASQHSRGRCFESPAQTGTHCRFLLPSPAVFQSQIDPAPWPSPQPRP